MSYFTAEICIYEDFMPYLLYFINIFYLKASLERRASGFNELTCAYFSSPK